MTEPTGLLFCADPLWPNRPAPHFADEVAAGRAAGGVGALIDHDALAAGDATGSAARVARGSGPYGYRGWMGPSGRYAEWEEALALRGCALLTRAAAYRRAHELPGWDGVGRVVEVGDGQVSGLPTGSGGGESFAATAATGPLH